VSQLRRLKELDTENARLKKMYAELSLNHEAFKEAVEKKRTVTTVVRRERVSFMIREYCIPVRQTCRTARLARSAFYAPRPPHGDQCDRGLHRTPSATRLR
jgi:putative transposase